MLGQLRGAGALGRGFARPRQAAGDAAGRSTAECRSVAVAARSGSCPDPEDAGHYRSETGQGPVRRPARGAPSRSRRNRHDLIQDRQSGRSARALRQLHAALDDARPGQARAGGGGHGRCVSRPYVQGQDHDDRAGIRADTRMMTIRRRCRTRTRPCCPGCSSTLPSCCRRRRLQVVLPETAVDYTLYGDSAYVVREDGTNADGKPLLKAVRTPVKTGKRWDGKVAVLSGVNPGDTVVAAGQVKLPGRRSGRRYRQAAAPAGQADPAIGRARTRRRKDTQPVWLYGSREACGGSIAISAPPVTPHGQSSPIRSQAPACRAQSKMLSRSWRRSLSRGWCNEQTLRRDCRRRGSGRPPALQFGSPEPATRWR